MLVVEVGALQTDQRLVREVTAAIVPVLTQLDTGVAIVCFGSTALGTSDVQSDIDLLVLCDPAVPPVHQRRHHFEQHPALSELVLDEHTAGWDTPWAPQTDTFTFAQRRYDVSYNSQAWLTQLVRAVRTTGATSLPAMPFRPYTVLGLLATAVILYDPHDIARDLVNQTQPYPPELKTHILDEFVPILQDSVDELHNYAARGIGNTAFLFHLVRACDALPSCLFALNDTYDPATKRVEEALQTLPRLPADFAARYRQVLEGPFTATRRHHVADQLATLTREVLALR